MISQNITKQELFDLGVTLSTKFLIVNKLFLPQYFTYEQVFAGDPNEFTYKILRRLESGPHQGYGTGYYTNNRVFVNLKKAAHLVKKPMCTSWSFPAYKIDREPCGVVAHETGHHVDKCYGDISQGSTWANIVKNSKAITSYEPNLAESMAETLRLFILNPDLLERGSTPRFDFLISGGLKPSETRDFRQVLDHPDYIAQAEKWIAKRS